MKGILVPGVQKMFSSVNRLYMKLERTVCYSAQNRQVSPAGNCSVLVIIAHQSEFPDCFQCSSVEGMSVMGTVPGGTEGIGKSQCLCLNNVVNLKLL